MTIKTLISNQIENRNFLEPAGFTFQIQRAPKVTYFGNSVNIPGIYFSEAEQPTYLKDIPIPGTKLDFEDLDLNFLVDEDLENYLEIQNWLRGIAYPDSLSEIYKFQKNNSHLNGKEESQLNLYSDATLTILNSANRPAFKVIFENIFPVRLSSLDFDASQSDVQYFTSTVSFKYTIYNITEIGTCC